MRSGVWVVMLGALAGAVMLWFPDLSSDDDSAPLVVGVGEGDTAEDQGDDEFLKSEVQDVIILEVEGRWPQNLMLDGALFMDPFAVDAIEVVSPTGKDYSLTGAEFLLVLKRLFKGTPYQFRFRDKDSLQAFKKCVLKGPIPAHAPLRLLLDQVGFAGYQFVTYADKIFVTPAEPGVMPGAGEEIPMPIEGIEPERRR